MKPVRMIHCPDPAAEQPVDLAVAAQEAAQAGVAQTAPSDLAQALEELERLACAGRVEETLAAGAALQPRLDAEGSALQQGICQHMLLLAHQYAGRVRESALAGYRAIDWLAQTDAADRLARSLTAQAIGMARMGDAAESLALLERAIALLPRLLSRPRDCCILWNNVCAALLTLGKLEQASDAAERAMRLVQEVDEPDLAAVCLCNRQACRLHTARAALATDGPAALEAVLADGSGLFRSLQRDGRLHFAVGVADALAEGLIDLQRLDEARTVLRRGLAAGKAIGALPESGGLQLRLAQLERLAGRPRAAARCIDAALDLLQGGNDLEQLARAHQEKCLQMEARRRWRQALESHKRGAELREQLLVAHADGRAQVLAIRLDLERARAEAQALRLRNVELEGDMDRLSVAASEFQRQALEDPLTGLANRRQFMRGVQALRERHRGTPLSLLAIDIDHFKRINDSLSHAVGDAVLCEFGALLRRLSRPHDVVARVGGEEFAVAFGDALELRDALRVAERLRSEIEHHDWLQWGCPLPVTASMGLAVCQPGETIADALARADRALYQSKADGRNRLRFVA
jgi:diguanylate cyclase (GGDEF)-like protein